MAISITPMFINSFLDYIRSDEVDPADPECFQEIICTATKRGFITCSKLAIEFEVNKATISRWQNRKTLPHPMMRPIIIKWIEEYVEGQLKNFRASVTKSEPMKATNDRENTASDNSKVAVSQEMY